MITLRERMIGLPLQRSVFDLIDTAADLIGLAGAVPDGRFPATLDASGSLLVDPTAVDTMREAFLASADRAFLEEIEARRRARCTALADATRSARDAGARSDKAGQRAAAIELLQRLAEFIPYALLTKFVPDLLLQQLLAEDPDWTPAHLGPSAGLQLTLSLERLLQFMAAHGQTPGALAEAWPVAPSGIVLAVRRFCAVHAGFGPVPWDGPGYDSPEHVMSTLRGLEREELKTGSERMPEYSMVEPDPQRLPMTLAGILDGWIELTDLQIWYVRTAFYHGLVPLLVALGEEMALPPERLLFVSRHELAEDAIPATREIDRRMHAYWTDESYLAQNAVSTGRLESMFQVAA